jgi:hypothetical protein
MQKKSIILVFLSVFVAALLLSGCAALQKPTESNFKDPVNIENPNSYPIMMNSFKFACIIDGFEVNSGYSTEEMWIPAGKTNQLRVEVLFDPRGTMLSLGIVAGQQLKAKGVGLWDALEKIWTQAPDFSFPVGVTQGAAVFKADGITKVVGFEGAYP